LEKGARDQSLKAGGPDGGNRSMRERDWETGVALGFWLEKTVKKLFSWSETEYGDENGGVLGALGEEWPISLLDGIIASLERLLY
jgi:hypothetical protein